VLLPLAAGVKPRCDGQRYYRSTAIPSRNGKHYSWKLNNAQPLETFITRPNSLQPYTLILVTFPVPPEILDVISEHSQATGVPIFYVHCLGFYSQFTIQLPPVFPIVDTHPDPATTTDLRLLQPWPELMTLVNEKTQNLDQLDDEDHGHVSYLLLLLHYLQEWEASHGSVPHNYKEKTEFKELVRKGTRTKNAEGGEENFNEAVSAVLKSLNKSEPSGAVKEVFAADECVHLNKDVRMLKPHHWNIKPADDH